MASKRFQGQTAIVTGAGQGIGFEICRQLAEEGAGVILNDIDEWLAQQSAEKIRAENGNCQAIGGDAGSLTVIHKIIDSAVKHFGSIDVTIANAGITLFGEFLGYSKDSFDKVMSLNLGGSFFLAQQAALQMKKQGSGGSILFMSSVTGHQAHRNLAAYGMTKAALEMLARNLVIELSPLRVNINCIAPGATLTERTLDDPEYEKTWSAITPMGRPAKIQDIAQAALFLVSPQARHITGQSLVIDGGWTATSPSPYKD
jgi:3-oxoacyl-[acyl-carrier protein] reductase